MSTLHSLVAPLLLKMFPLSTIMVVLVSLLTACKDGGMHHSDAIPEEDGNIYLLVGEPCSDGDYATKKEADIARLKVRELTWTLVALCCAFVIAVGGVLLFVSHRRAMRRLKVEKQKQYVHGLEQERQRIARELHDDIAGRLIGLQWKLQTSDVDDAQHLATEIATRVRRMSHEMMPPEFREMTFTQMLTEMVARVDTYGDGKRVKLTDEGSFDWDSLSSEECFELYRFVQEAISNAFRHGSGDTVRIILNGDKRFVLSVINDICPEAISDEITTAGIRSMKARAAILKADLSISTDNGSFKLTISQNN